MPLAPRGRRTHAMNKYLQHIIRKSNKSNSLATCVSAIQAKKRQDLKTYLFLVQKRLKLQSMVTTLT